MAYLIMNSLKTISIVYFLQTHLFTEKFTCTTTIHPGILSGRDSVSLWMNTIASRDQFNSIRIGEYFVKCNG